MKHYGDTIKVPPPLSSTYAVASRPKTGSLVKWDAIQAVDRDSDTASRLGIEIKGIIGNSSHLAKYGGHTPWRLGSKVGPEWAGDYALSPEQFAKVLTELRAGGWDNLVRFVNYGGWQYSNDDSFKSRIPNSDDHLHLEYENAALLYDGPSLLQAALLGEEEEMNATQDKLLREAHWAATRWIPELRQQVVALKAAIDSNANPAEITAALKANNAQLVTDLTPGIKAAIIAAMPEANAEQIESGVEAGLKDFFGKLAS